MLSEGQRNDIHFAVPVLEHISIEGSYVLADRGYDNHKLIDYIYDNGREPTRRSRQGSPLWGNPDHAVKRGAVIL